MGRVTGRAENVSAMRIFEVRASGRGPGTAKTYEVNATRMWSLPGVECPACGQIWANSATTYPSIDLARWHRAHWYQLEGPVPFAEFERLRDALRPYVPGDIQLQPGTQFGPLVGTAYGVAGDFAGGDLGSLLVRRGALRRLRGAGIANLRAVTPRLDQGGVLTPDELACLGIYLDVDLRTLDVHQARWEEFVELDIPPSVLLSDASYRVDPAGECSLCGRLGITIERIIVDLASLPQDADLFRPRQATGYILATERFVAAVEHLGLSGLVAREVEVMG